MEQSVKFGLTDLQALRLLCVLGQRSLCTVRSIQSTENAHHEDQGFGRKSGGRIACRRCHDPFGGRFATGDGDGLGRRVLCFRSAVLVTVSRMIPFAEAAVVANDQQHPDFVAGIRSHGKEF